MFFGKYQVVLIKEKTGKMRTLSLRGGFVLSLFLLLILLFATNIYLMQFYKANINLKAQLEKTEQVIEERQEQLLTLIADAEQVKDSLNRLQQFNTKLRLMTDMELAQAEIGLGGASPELSNLGALPLHRQELASRKIRTFFKELETAIKLEEVNQQEILLGMRENLNLYASMPSIMPVEGFISSNFGYRNSPFTGRKKFHKGIDIAAPKGTAIVAPANGVVTKISNNGAYGKSIEISHGSGIVTKYAHLNEFHVEKGQKVKRNELIGTVGSTGRSTGPHLHYEVRLNDVVTDPKLYIVSN